MTTSTATMAEAAFRQGLGLHQQGRLEEARTLYRQALELQPEHCQALHLLGVVALQTNHPEPAAELIGRSILIDAQFAAAHLNYGSALSRLNRHEAAIASFDKAIALQPDYADAYFNRGNTLRELKRFEAAVESYDRAIALKPDNADAYVNRGNALRDLKRYHAAIENYDAALSLKPDYADAYFNRGTTRHELKQYEAAIAEYDRAIGRNPRHAESYNNRGMTLAELKQYTAAIASYDTAIALKPDFASAFVNRGNALRAVQQLKAAVASYDAAIAIKPNNPDAYSNRGYTLRELRQYEAAIASFDQAIALKPELKGVYAMRLYTRLQLCDWRGFDSELAQLEAKIEVDATVENPLCVVALSGSARLQQKAAQAWVREEFPPNPALPALPKRREHKRIHIGYFSADFRIHPVAQLTAELFETHDQSRFEVSGFSLGPDTKDPMRRRLERAFDRFIDVRERSDQDIALLARSMELDIAIDLGGFTEGSRANMFALRAAPLQVNYLGYPGTMGSGYMDYLIADATTIPADRRQHYGEKIICLPNSYFVNDSTRTVSDTAFSREQCGLPPSGCVFCCFNTHYKITPATFESWMRILRRVAGSVLWLSEGHPRAIGNLRREAEQRGVSAERLIFAQRIDSLPEHLARYRLADLFLDTLPYNAHTTASDALWAGLPVLTRLGEAFAGRVAGSLLRAIGLPELIAATEARYEQLAVELATDPERLARIRQTLAHNRLAAPLFDTPRFTRHLEAAYGKIIERYQAGLPPEDLYLTSE